MWTGIFQFIWSIPKMMAFVETRISEWHQFTYLKRKDELSTLDEQRAVIIKKIQESKDVAEKTVLWNLYYQHLYELPSNSNKST